MKNYMKLFAIATVLTISSLAYAQQDRKELDSKQFQVGDTVIITEETTHYLTGEKPSTWVYNKKHTIMQIGTKRFPDGILLKEIYSWVKLYELVPANEEQMAERAKAAQKQQQKAETEQQQEEEPQEVVPQDTVPAVVEPVEPVKQDTVQQAEQVEEQPKDTVMPDGIVRDYQPSETKKDIMFATQGARLDRMNRFSIGVRGGAASLMHDADEMGKWKVGFDALLDLQYAHYFGAKYGKKANHGILTGLSVGWSQSGIKSDINNQYQVTTDDGTIDYSINAKDVNEKDGELVLELPIFYTLLTENGFFFNVGPRLSLPVYSHYKQTMQDPHVNATFVEEGVTVSDEVITGLVKDDQMKTKGKWSTSKLNVMLSAELGYEWLLKKSGNSLGLGAYANYSVYTLYKNDTENKSLIDVTAPSKNNGAAAVDVLSATDTYNKGLGYFDVGVKLIYHFNFPVR